MPGNLIATTQVFQFDYCQQRLRHAMEPVSSQCPGPKGALGLGRSVHAAFADTIQAQNHFYVQFGSFKESVTRQAFGND